MEKKSSWRQYYRLPGSGHQVFEIVVLVSALLKRGVFKSKRCFEFRKNIEEQRIQEYSSRMFLSALSYTDIGQRERMSMASKAISYFPFHVSILEIALRCLLYFTRENLQVQEDG